MRRHRPAKGRGSASRKDMMSDLEANKPDAHKGGVTTQPGDGSGPSQLTSDLQVDRPA